VLLTTFDPFARTLGSTDYRRLARMDAIREVLTGGGRTLAQGALGWVLARSPRTVPIPGIRTVAQAEQNAATLRLGPLPATAMAEIARLLID